MSEKKGYSGILFLKDEMELLINNCSYEDIGFLFERIYRFGFEGRDAEDMPPRLKFAWDFMKMRQTLDREHYEQKCEKNAQNARQRVSKEKGSDSSHRVPQLTQFD